MHTVEYGPNNYKFSVTNSSADYHKNMLAAYFIKPFMSSLQGATDHFAVKLGMFLSSLPALFALDLFTTPSTWWKGLIYLVIMDWLAGVVNAVYRGTFDWNVAVSKWYQVVSYVIVCGSSAVISNTFDNIFWYFQYLVYTTFFLKEFVSILKTFRLLTLLKAIHKVYAKSNKLSGIDDVISEAQKEFENHK